MRSFNQKTKIDLPNIRKKQVCKNKQTNCFDLLFDDKSNVEPPFSRDINQRGNSLNVSYLYMAIGLASLVIACFLVVQTVVNSPEIEKYKAVIKNIEDIDMENDN